MIILAIGTKIRYYRNKKKWTQKELAEKLNLATGTIQQYELGKRTPSVETLQQLASILEVSADDIINVPEFSDEYEMICEILNDVNLKIEPAGDNTGTGDFDGDIFYIFLSKDEGNPEEYEKIEYKRLAEIVHQVLKDAETNKREYIRKRLYLELF